MDKRGEGKMTKSELLKRLSENYKSKKLSKNIEKIYKN